VATPIYGRRTKLLRIIEIKDEIKRIRVKSTHNLSKSSNKS